MKSKLGILCAVVIVYFFSSCSMPIGTASNLSGKSGTVVISIPRINPYIIENQTTTTKQLSSKAFAYVDSIEVDLYQMNGETEEFVQSATLDEANYDPVTNTINGTISIRAGTYSRLIVSVFNSAVSTTVPVVAGQTDASFEVLAGGETEIQIVLYPTSPVQLVEGVYSEETTLAVNAEKWYSFTAPGTITRITSKTISGDVNAYIFGPDGKPIDGILGTDPEESVNIETIPYEIYYICLIANNTESKGQVAFENVSGSVNISFE